MSTTFSTAYVGDLGSVIDFDAIRGAGMHMGVDPLGGAGVHYWAPIAERYRLDLTVVSEEVDPTVRLHDGGLGRQDPHGPLVVLCDAAPDRPEGSHTTSRLPAIPTTIATASSRAAAGCCRPITTCRC